MHPRESERVGGRGGREQERETERERESWREMHIAEGIGAMHVLMSDSTCMSENPTLSSMFTV